MAFLHYSELVQLNNLLMKEHVCVCVCVLNCFSLVQLLATPWAARLLYPWDFPGKNTGVGCHFLIQGIFLTQVLNLYLLCVLHCKQILYQLSHRGVKCLDRDKKV